MAEFDNPYAKGNPFLRAHFDCPNCGGKLWEYAIERAMVCEDCRQYWKPEEALAYQESQAEAQA